MVSARALDPVAMLATSMFLVAPFAKRRRAAVACLVAVVVTSCLVSGAPSADRTGAPASVASTR